VRGGGMETKKTGDRRRRSGILLGRPPISGSRQ